MIDRGATEQDPTPHCDADNAPCWWHRDCVPDGTEVCELALVEIRATRRWLENIGARMPEGT